MTAFARWERLQHGNLCRLDVHLAYRVRRAEWVEIRCKLCYHMDIERYEDSRLNTRGEVAA